MKLFRTLGRSFLVLLLFSVSSGCQEDQEFLIPIAPKDGLVSEYLFVGNFDDTVGGDVGVAEGGPIFITDRFGHPSSALGLDGIDDKVTATRARFASGDSVSISLWLRVPLAQVSFRTVVTSGEFTVATFDDFSRGGQVGATFPTTCDPRRSVCGAIGNLSRGTWHHVLATYDGVNMSIYVDGDLVNQLLVSSPLFGSDQPLTLGFSSSFWEGSLDDIRIYGRSIFNMTEVSDLYHEGGYAM